MAGFYALHRRIRFNIYSEITLKVKQNKCATVDYGRTVGDGYMHSLTPVFGAAHIGFVLADFTRQ